MKNYLNKRNKFLIITFSVLLLAVTYGVLAQLFINWTDWKGLIYNNKFVSIQPKHLAIWSGFIFANLAYLLYSTTEFTKSRVFYKLFIVLLMAGFGTWFTFDAFNRSFATLPNIASELSESSVVAIALMSVFEIAIGITLIILASKLLLRVTSVYLDKRNKKIDKFMKITDYYAICLYSLIFIAQLLVFIAFNKNGLGNITNRRWPNIGPQNQGVIALIGLFYAWRRISTSNTKDNKEWSMNILTTIIFSLVAGFFFHDNILFMYDYVSNSGTYFTEQVWGFSVLIDTSLWLLLTTIPLLFILMILYLTKLTVLVNYISGQKFTKKDRKKLNKFEKKQNKKKLRDIKKASKEKELKQEQDLAKKAAAKKQSNKKPAPKPAPKPAVKKPVTIKKAGN